MENLNVGVEEYDQAVAVLEKMAGLDNVAARLAAVVQRSVEDQISGGRSKVWKPDLRYRSLVEKLPAVTFMCGLDERIQELYISPQIEGMLGFTQEEWLENPLLWYRQLHPDDRQSWVDQFALTCATGAHFRSEYRLLNRAGDIVWIQGECQLIRDDDGTPLFLQGIAIDITHLKRAADAVEAKRAADAANSAKSEFLARMSHEIRTPLNGVVGMIDLLCSTGMNENQQRYANLARDAAGALLVVINDILDFSKIEAGKVEIEKTDFDLHKLIEDTVELLAPLAARKNLVMGSLLRPDVPRTVIGDPGRIRQVITNLVSNALKFTQKGTVSVRVALQGTADDLATVRIQIEDTGIGIPANRVDRLFKSFSQVDSSTTRKYGGTGLGLVICKRLAELMGGEIGVTSVEGKGTTFWFTIKLQALRPDPASAPIDLRRMRVLAVESELAFHALLTEQLYGISPSSQVTAEADALDLLHAAAREGNPFDVALVPFAASDSALWKAIRRDSSFLPTHLVAVLSIDDATDVKAIQQAGFAAAIRRPITQSKLVDAIATATLTNRPAQAAAPTDAAPEGLQGLHLLVAEDNEMNQFVARETLNRVGCTCDIVSDGAQALEAAKTGRHHAILMDCQMPVMDGLESSRRIRQWEAGSGKRIPIIALTAEALQGDREKCLAAGMDSYVTKPIDADALFAAISSFAKTGPVEKAPATAPAAQPVPAAPLAPVAPIAVDELLSRCLNDPDFARQTLQKFHRRALDDVQKLTQLLAEGKSADLGRLAHNLKSVAAHVAAGPLEAIAADIEQAGQRGDLQLIRKQLSQLDREARRCSDYIPTAAERLAQVPRKGK